MNSIKKSKVEFTTRTMAYMAIFGAIQIILEYCTKVFEMPQGGNVAFSLVAIFLCTYLMGWGYGVIVSMVCLGLHFALGLAVFYGPLSVIFDYLVPMVLVGMTGLIPLMKVRNKNDILLFFIALAIVTGVPIYFCTNLIFLAIDLVVVIVTGICVYLAYDKTKNFELPVGIIVVCIFKTISHLLAGWYAFQTPLVGNLIYNLPYNIGTMIVCLVLFMILYPRLKKAVRF